jgi:hypothetical protein
MHLEKNRDLIIYIVIIIVAIFFMIITVFGTNPETVIAIATIALVTVTVFLVRATIQLANITKNQDKPRLYFYLINEDAGVNLYIENVGKGAAIDVHFKMGSMIITFPVISLRDKIQLPVADLKEFQIENLTYKDINEMPMNSNRTVKPQLILWHNSKAFVN